jgi:hypothetical protein
MVYVAIQILLPMVILVHVHLVSVVLNASSTIDRVKQTLVRIMVYLILSCLDRKHVFLCFVGLCNETSNTTFTCSCVLGWRGTNCETQINYCQDIVCQNNGVCRPLFRNYTCECLGDSFSGQYCEIKSNKIITRQMVSKSFGYIAIIAMGSIALFIVLMDVLKYYFGIDVTRKKLKQNSRGKQKKTRKAAPIVLRYIYVNAPISQAPENLISTIE